MNLFAKQQYLEEKFNDLHFEFYEEIDSTNEKCKELCRKKYIDKWVIIANSQTKGRGRYGRTWDSQAKNIYISFATANAFVHDIVTLNFYLGVVLYRTLIDVFPEIQTHLTLKWPNDLYFNDKKLGGILIENVDNELKWIVVGMGINVYSGENEIPNTATSLQMQEIKDDNVRVRIIERLLHNVYLTNREEDYRELFWEYCRKTQYNVYRYTKHNEIHAGIAQKLHADGSMTIRDTKGQQIHLQI
ncbi:biotin--[acetyl-CoA-carboxylase] ligase [Candidatus Uabimicrobium sp. HlEnr_7]|uniref:biotin--[acetyl-CoA-carboxylase] ligase n=1 Tax=Candidatus Uabimicrobium helgolandensis TaxID=3095367 RepID=UPI0035591A19